MTLLITGAGRPLGRLAVAHFQGLHEVTPVYDAPRSSCGSAEEGDLSVDLRTPGEVAPLLGGADAVLHLGVYDPPPVSGDAAEQEWLDVATRGTYVLLREARNAGVERVVLASTLDLFAGYRDDHVVDEGWKPRPRSDAVSLSAHLCETVCREFSREGGIRAICLRFGALGRERGTSERDATEAMSRALAMPLRERGYRWHVFHVSSDDRFPMRSVAQRDFGLARSGGA